MKKFLFYSLAIVILGSFSSCSTDADDNFNPDQEIIGVWKQEVLGLEGLEVSKLIFEPNYECFITSSVNYYESDYWISNIQGYNWELNGNVVSILKENNDILKTFTLNSNGELISSNSEEVPYDKISDTTSGYY